MTWSGKLTRMALAPPLHELGEVFFDERHEAIGLAAVRGAREDPTIDHAVVFHEHIDKLGIRRQRLVVVGRAPHRTCATRLRLWGPTHARKQWGFRRRTRCIR